MRRSDREVTDILELLKIIDSCKVLRLGMQDELGLYIVPLNFGYSYISNQLTFYIHSAKKGRKISALESNPLVCFEMDLDHKLITGEKACDYGYSFKSIIGNGKVEFLNDFNEISDALNYIMKHQTNKTFSFTEKDIENISVFKIVVSNFAGKYHK